MNIKQTNAHTIFSIISPKGTYGHNIIDSKQALSGCDLKGKARRYSYSYYRARQKAAVACTLAKGHIRIGKRNKLTFAWGRIPKKAKRKFCSLGTAWKY